MMGTLISAALVIMLVLIVAVSIAGSIFLIRFFLTN